MDGQHYFENDKAAPVVNDMTICIVMVMMLLAGWWAELLDTKGVFLNGCFENGEVLYMEIPQVFEKFWLPNELVRLLKTIYGLKQVAIHNWHKSWKAFQHMGYSRSKVDPCMYYKWTTARLVVWIIWVDGCLIVGPMEEVLIAKAKLMELFDCDDVGMMKEYVGCKVDMETGKYIKLTQPVMIPSFKDEFGVDESNCTNTPAIPGTFLHADEKTQVSKEKHAKYCTGVVKLLHMMRWSHPDILNAVRELSRFVSAPAEAHMQAVYRVISYVVGTKTKGLTMKPNGQSWDRSKKRRNLKLLGRVIVNMQRFLTQGIV